ncbi:MAG: hypothetical protein ACREOB_04705, partial [Thermodesulfobacteriota bacterium]
RSGSRCLEISAAAAIEVIGWTTDTIGASQNRAVVAFWFLFPTSLPSADIVILDVFKTNVDAQLMFRNSDDKLVMTADGNIGGGGAQAGPTIVADTWYFVECHIDVSAVIHTIDWQVDLVAQTQCSSAQAVGTITQIILGDGDAAQTMTCRYDDVVIWSDTAAITTYPHGKQKVILLKADTGGTTAEIGTANATSRFTGNATADATHNSANILAAISEVPPLIGDTATGVCQRTSGAGNAVGIPMTTYTLAAGESITGLRIVICGWAGSATANNYGMRTFNGTTEDIIFAAADPNFDNNTTQPAWMCEMVVAASFDTQAEIDALVIRLGYSTDIAPLPGAHAVFAEFAVKESTAAPAVKNPSFVSQYGSYL